MIITGPQAFTPAAAQPNSHPFRSAARVDARPPAESSEVSISAQALQMSASPEGRAADAASPYRLGGSAVPVSSLAPTVYKMPEVLVREMEVRTKEEALRQEISSRYASEHRYQTVGQVLVDGKFFAEVDDAGGYGSAGTIPGLSEATLDPRARLEEIARAAKDFGKVEIRYTDFVPGTGGWGGPAAPESMLPAFTARDIREIFAEAIASGKQLRSTSPPSRPDAS